MATALEDFLFVTNDSTEVLQSPKQLSSDLKKLADTLIAHKKLYFTSNQRSNYDEKGYQVMDTSPINEITKTQTSIVNVNNHMRERKGGVQIGSLKVSTNNYENVMEMDESGGDNDGLLIDRGICYENVAVSDNLCQSLPISVVRKEFPGFSSLGPDLYISIADPCLQVQYHSFLSHCIFHFCHPVLFIFVTLYLSFLSPCTFHSCQPD